MMLQSFMLYLGSAFMMGIFSGAHCIGMCGGIICTLSYSCQRKPNQTWLPFFYQLFYSFGRITTYSVLGVVSGLAGYAIAERMGTQSAVWIRYASSVFVILSGLYISGWWQWIAPLERAGKIIWRPVSGLTKYFLPVSSLHQAWLLGALWGLLPCGMVYSALLFSLGGQSVLNSALIMFAFGLGTLPALLLAGSLMHYYQQILAARWVRHLSGVTLIAFGMIMIWFLQPQSLAHHCMS